MNKPTLVIMAAGMGSRYGGLKQIDPVGLNGEIIIDYSIYDALKAGFVNIVFIIKESIECDFRKIIGDRIEKYCDVTYVYQEINILPEGFNVPDGRVKPWGTGHAIMLCKELVNEPFAVINADDYYGAASFQTLSDYLANTPETEEIANYYMVGYSLKNTLTDHGHVARGVCKINDQGYLTEIHERTHIKKLGEGAKYSEDGGKTWVELSVESIVSMNMWGFTPDIFSELEKLFPQFLKQTNDLNNSEFFIPEVVSKLIEFNKASVQVIQTPERWVGVTYREDKSMVEDYIASLISEGKYPEKLWS